MSRILRKSCATGGGRAEWTKRVGLFGTGPSVLDAWGEDAVCFPDRSASGAERLCELPRRQFHLLSQRAPPRDFPAAVRVLRRGATGMREIRNESVLQLEQLFPRFRARPGELPLRSVTSVAGLRTPPKVVI